MNNDSTTHSQEMLSLNSTDFGCESLLPNQRVIEGANLIEVGFFLMEND